MKMNSENLSEGLQSFKAPGGNYNFTGMPVGDIGAMEQTLYTLVTDESGSTSPFRPDMVKAIKEIVKSLQNHPRS